MSTGREVKLNQVANGAILTEDLKDSNGDMLLAAGSTLSQEVLNRLEKRGVMSVCIEDEEVSEQDREVLRQQTEAKLEYLFARQRDVPMMRDLKQMLLSWHCRGL